MMGARASLRLHPPLPLRLALRELRAGCAVFTSFSG